MLNSNSVEAQLFDTDNLSPREQVTNWVKIKEKLGTRVSGKFLGYWNKPAEGVFRAAVCVALRDFNDPSIVHGVTLPDYFEKTFVEYRLGDRVGFEYYKDIPSKEAGISATKAVRAFNLDLKGRKERGEQTTTELKPVPAAAPDETKSHLEEDEGPEL